MEVSLIVTLVLAAVLVLVCVAANRVWLRARRRQREWQSWEQLRISYPELDRELDRIWPRQ
jgi:hypothetical protein